MATYRDSANGGQINDLTGTDAAGDVFFLGAGQDVCTGAGHDIFNISGGAATSQYGDSFNCQGTTGNQIYLSGAGTNLYLADFLVGQSVQTIYAASGGSIISADQTATTGTTLDFSQTALVGITRIVGSAYGDTITGSGQASVLVQCGAGNDTIYESGSDTAAETTGADTIDGGGGFNVYVAYGAMASYQPATASTTNGVTQMLYHVGTGWTFTDIAGRTITLTNIQEVRFADQTVYSGTALTLLADTDGRANTVAIAAATGSLVGITAFATDPNPGETLTYSLVSAAGGAFTIDPVTGVVSVADGALITAATASYAVTVQASDGTLSTRTTFNVTAAQPLANLIDTDATANTVAVDAATGTTVGITASATDPNGAAVTYSLVDAQYGPFAIDPVTGVVTVANGTLIDGSASSYTVTVQASDGTLTSQYQFTVAVSLPTNFLAAVAAGSTLAASNGGGWTLSGGMGDDVLTGGTGNDVLSAGLGLNYESGGGGSDTYVMDYHTPGGTGAIDFIDNGIAAAPTPAGTLAVAPDIGTALWLTRVGNSLVLNALGVGGGVDIIGWYDPATPYRQLAGLQLADGSQITAAQMTALAGAMAAYQAANPGFSPSAAGAPMPADSSLQAALQSGWARTIRSGAARAVLTSGLGNNALYGSGGQDTYLIGPDAGLVSIYNGGSGLSAPTGTLSLQAGLDPGALWLVQSGLDLIVQVLGTGRETFIKDWYDAATPYRQLAGLTLTDGSTIATGQITALAATMTAYRQTHSSFNPHAAGTVMPTDATVRAALQTDWTRNIAGTAGGDTLGSQYGDATLVGNGGSDTYLLAPGYGQDTIVNGLATSNIAAGELDLAAPITATTVWIDRVTSAGAVSATGSDLRFLVMGSTSAATVRNWFTAGDSFAQLAEIKLVGSGLMLDSTLANLLSAMDGFEARYAASHAGAAFDPSASVNATITDPTVLAAIAIDWHH